MSKQIRIYTLLVIDTLFFLLEAIIGYSTHSLALIADSFHMLNDIVSLFIALYAIKAKSTKKPNEKYTYGYQRAEILGALINSVFLIALCFTIFMEALQRFFEPQIIKNPKLILIVGSCGLVSNFVGLVLFHEHGHSHSHGSHGASHGNSHSHGGHEGESASLNYGGENSASFNENSGNHGHSHGGHVNNSTDFRGNSDEERNIGLTQGEGLNSHKIGDLGKSDSSGHKTAPLSISSHIDSNDKTNLLKSGDKSIPLNTNSTPSSTYGSTISEYLPDNVVARANDPLLEKNSKKKKSMNMEGVFLHVLGDALGNIGVILTAFFIWKTDYSWKYYSDPFISVVITIIIFSSALPLCLRSSKILLQATPINSNEIIEKILKINLINNIHDFHIWNLNEDILIASIHIELDTLNQETFSKVVSEVREILHNYGIHSATIQPEFGNDLVVSSNTFATTKDNCLVDNIANCDINC